MLIGGGAFIFCVINAGERFMSLRRSNGFTLIELMVTIAVLAILAKPLVLLLYGGISSTQYALEYKETSYSAWSPPMAPIKIVMCIGIALMLLQAIATLFKDIAAARGEPL